MQNKGVIRLFAILLALVCVYHLMFTWKTYQVRNDAEEYAQAFSEEEQLEKERFYLDSIAGETVFTFIRSYTFSECQQRELNLGLDLKGGMSVILEIYVPDVIHSLANQSKDSVFLETMALAEKYKDERNQDFVTLFGMAFDEVAPDGRMSQFFYGNPKLKGLIQHNSSNEEVMDVLREETNDAINNSFNILRNRIDQFGVSQPNIQQLEANGRIMVELPGVDNPDRVKRLLESSAQLEFFETYKNDQEFYSMLEKANEVIRAYKEVKKDSLEEAGHDIDDEGDTIDEEMEKQAVSENEDDTMVDDEEGDLSDIMEDVEDTDTSEEDTTLTQQTEEEEYPLFAKLYPALTGENQLAEGPVVGMAKEHDISRVNRYLSLEKVRAIFPRDLEFKWSAKPVPGTENVYQLYAIKSREGGKPPLDGDVVTTARHQIDQTTGSAQVSMSMNAEGSKKWARLTRENVGEYVAILLDERVYSAPVVRDEIRGGQSSISGDFSVNEAKDLATVLESGKMPAPAKIVQSTVVGPSLGQESINAGLNSFLIAFLVILLYMIFYYSRRAGLVADIALLANMFFLIGVLASLGAVLTLPGIAGIVLTIGMSVDANVLIYERIREELKAGKGAKLAVKDGYNNAYSAIIDANVTTLLTGIILFIFGTGPIKGFATTLIIGILTSLFSAIFITRLVFEQVLDKKGKLSFSTKLTEGAFKNTKINFIDKRKIYYAISTVIILIGVFSLVSRGLNYGVDFTGGRKYVVRFEQPVNTLEIKQLLQDKFESAPEVITFGGDNQVRITTQYKFKERGSEIDAEIEKLLYTGLTPLLEGVDMETFEDEYIKSSEKIISTIANEIRDQAYWTILFSLTVVFLYILVRFRKWQFGLGAVAALIHDTLIVIGLFSLLHHHMPFALEVDQAFIAAILTVVGYSINDTVVVFDRIREFTGLYPKRDTKELYNTSLNSTLSRTFSTSLSTFVVMMTIFIFGGEVIRGFIFALLVGVVVGTYSSLFVASPIAYDLLRRSNKKKSKSK